MASVVSFLAPAKLNLSLQVFGKRPDGYHHLRSVMVPVSLYDEVTVEEAPAGISVKCDAPGIPTGSANSCHKAAALFLAWAGTPPGVRIRIRKAIPAESGLGGGSSDAAAALKGLIALTGKHPPPDTLLAMAIRVGADVPFFLPGGAALVEGIGERLQVLELPPAWYLVLVPPVRVSTREVFASSALTRDTKPLKITPFFQGLGRNDLEPVVTAQYPEVAAQLDWLRQHCPGARMTGSGACVFAAFDSAAEARALQSRVPASMHGFLAEGLDHHPLYDWAQD